MKRILPLFLSLFLLISAVPAVSAAQIVATEEDVILLAGSDFQVGNQTHRIENILSVLEIYGLTKADGAFFVGDYTAEKRETNTSSEGIRVLKDLFRPIVGNNMIFTQGNHDHVDTVGLAKDGNNDPASGKYGVFVINENQRMEYNDDSSYDDTLEAANALKAYLDDKAAKGFTKPIFVLNHIGLHWGNRTISQGVAIHAELLVKVLNEAGAKGLNIIYLYGHNHSSGYDDAMGGGAVYFKKGDQIEVPISAEYFVDAHAAKKKHTTYTLNFTYMNAGYIGYYSTTEPTTDATVTMSVFLVRGDEVIITRYDEKINLLKNKVGVHPLKSAGVWHEDYKGDGYAVPNTLEYASSRKVTATDDMPVEPPRYSPLEEDEPEETTTAAPTTENTTVPSAGSTAPADPIGTGTPSIEAPTTTEIIYGPCPDPSSIVTDPSQTVIDSPCVMPEDGEEDTSATPQKGLPIGLILGIGGGVILIAGGVVLWFFMKRKK